MLWLLTLPVGGDAVGEHTQNLIYVEPSLTVRQPLRATSATERHEESKQAIGGMRRPRISQANIPGLKAAADKVNEAADAIIHKYPGVVDICCDALGGSDKSQVPDNYIIEELRAGIHAKLGPSPHALHFDDEVNADLVP